MHAEPHVGDEPRPLKKWIRKLPKDKQRGAIAREMAKLLATIQRDLEVVDVSRYDDEAERSVLLGRLDVAAGIYRHAAWNPLNWFAAALNVPLEIMKRARIEGFGPWYAKAVQASLLIVLGLAFWWLLDRLGVRIGFLPSCPSVITSVSENFSCRP